MQRRSASLAIVAIPALFALGLPLGVCGCGTSGTARSEPSSTDSLGHSRAAIALTLDRLHTAASKADGDTYFSLFTQDGCFLGTDATERWTLEEFKAYAMPYFSQGKGWTYTPRERFIHIDPSGRIAWFDEILDNAKYGECRGTGVARREPDGAWKIAQYSLTKLVPNESMEAAVKAIGESAKR